MTPRRKHRVFLPKARTIISTLYQCRSRTGSTRALSRTSCGPPAHERRRPRPQCWTGERRPAFRMLASSDRSRRNVHDGRRRHGPRPRPVLTGSARNLGRGETVGEKFNAPTPRPDGGVGAGSNVAIMAFATSFTEVAASRARRWGKRVPAVSESACLRGTGWRPVRLPPAT